MGGVGAQRAVTIISVWHGLVVPRPAITPIALGARFRNNGLNSWKLPIVPVHIAVVN
jgi:hypothetical protein